MNLQTAIQNTIFDTVLAAYADKSGDPSLSPYPNQNVVVARVWPGQIIDEAQYGDAWSPTNPLGIQAATENLSLLVDPIPNMDDWYSKSGRKVEEMYEFLIKSAEADLSSTQKPGLLRDTQTKSTKLISRKALISDLETETLPPNVKSELSERKIVEATLPDKSKINALVMTPESIKKKHLEIAHSNAAAADLAYRFAHDKAQTNVLYRTRSNLITPTSELVKATTKAWNDLQKTESATFSRSTVPYTPISVDKAFYDARMTFNRSTLASVHNPGIAYHPAYTSPENWVDPSAKESWPLLTIPVANTDPSVDLTITFSRIDITRPWLLSSLFDLHGWKNAEGPGSLSTGKTTDNNGSFSLMPQSMIVARDIVARTSTATVFRSSGLQVLAYVSKLVPYSPPS